MTTWVALESNPEVFKLKFDFVFHCEAKKLFKYFLMKKKKKRNRKNKIGFYPFEIRC